MVEQSPGEDCGQPEQLGGEFTVESVIPLATVSMDSMHIIHIGDRWVIAGGDESDADRKHYPPRKESKSWPFHGIFFAKKYTNKELFGVMKNHIF